VNPYRIGLIVPSSNTTMETELPELLRRREALAPERFTFHSARLRMTRVTPEALAAMNALREGAAAELADADCAVMAYACLVAVMASGPRAHLATEGALSAAASGRAVVTSAGALAAGVRGLGVRRVALVAPYLPALTATVIDYLADLGVEVVDSVSLGVADNLAVGRLDPARLPAIVDGMDLSRAEAVVVSACVQMPSLPAIPVVERRTGLPALSAATATTAALLRVLRLPPLIPDAGRLLAGTGVELPVGV
jgi:maleate isomerase